MIESFPCPQCKRVLHRSGELTIDGFPCPVFQCDHCIVTRSVAGMTADVNLTFAVDGAGRAFDPASPPPDASDN